MKQLPVVLIVISFILSTPVYSQLRSDSPTTNKLSQLLNAYHQNLEFSGAVSVRIGDTTVFENSYGYENRELKKVPNESTRFSINSISKLFVTVSILKLVERHQINLNSPIAEYLPELNSTWKNKVTVHHLMSHSSGLPREIGTTFKEFATLQDQAKICGSLDLLFEPGTRYEYSNAGFALLGRIIENRTSLPYPVFVEHEILEPLNLKNTGFNDGEKTINGLANEYTSVNGNAVLVNPFKFKGVNAAGGMYSTNRDLYQFMVALENHELLKDSLQKILFEPHYEIEGKQYAYVEIQNSGKELLRTAAGSGNGSKDLIARNPETGLFIGILSNWGETNVEQILMDIYFTIYGKDRPLPLAPVMATATEYKNFIGKFQFGPEIKTQLDTDTTILVISTINDQLFLDGEPLRVLKKGTLTLKYTDELTIKLEGNQLVIDINGNILKGQKIE